MKANLRTIRCDFRPSNHGLAWLPILTVRRSVTGSATRWHRHDEHEIIFLVDGSVTYVFRNGTRVDLKGGQFLVIRKGLVHQLLDNIDTPSFRLGFNLADVKADNTSPLTPDEHRLLVRTLLGVKGRAAAFPDATRSDLIALAQLVAEYDQSGKISPFGSVRMRMLCTRILFDCTEAVLSHEDEVASSPDNIDAAIAYIESHTEGPLDLSALIQYVGYSRSRFFSLFRQKTGLSPVAYHACRRLAAAQRMLDTTDLTSEQVSEQLGFDSPTYFSYAFKRYFGLTPIAFRKRRETSP